MNGAARIVLRDWSLGKFMRYTTPPVINTAAAQSSITTNITKLGDDITQLYANDEAILSKVQTRKERRKQGSLVKFSYESIDPRKAVVEEPWNGMEQDSDEEGDGDDDEDEDDEDENDVEVMDVDPEGDDEESDESKEEEEEEESDAEREDVEQSDQDKSENEGEVGLPHSSRKQKRKRGSEKSIHPPPAKKVAFSPMPPKSSKIERTPQQKKKPLKAVQASHSASIKSKLSTTAVAIVARKTSENAGKIANIMVKTKSKGHPDAGKLKEKSASEPEAYDFGKFFK